VVDPEPVAPDRRARLAVVTAGPPTPALDVLTDAARSGALDHGAEVVVSAVETPDPGALTERVLDGDALLLAFPAVLYGLPGALKSWLDSWLALLPTGRLIPRTARLRMGALVVWSPDEPRIGELVHRQLRAMCEHFGTTLVGRAGGFAPPGAANPADPAQIGVARRLGAVLAGAEGEAGLAPEYKAGIAHFNAGQFWEAHEEWEGLWLEAPTARRAFYQGLIQVAAAFHHHGNGNWGGMVSLLRDGMDKLRGYRPRAMQLDLETFLAALEPWRVWAEARAGRPAPVARRPEGLPRIELGSAPPPGSRAGG